MLKFKRTIMNEDNNTFYSIEYSFKTSLHLDLDEWKSVNEIFGKIYKEDEYYIENFGYKRKKTLIGNLNLSLYKPFMENSVLQSMDRSIDNNWVLPFFDKSGILKYSITKKFGDYTNYNVLVLENFLIKGKYRNKGIGKLVLDCIKEHFRPMCGYFLLSSYPMQFCEKSKEKIGKDYEIDKLDKDEIKASKSLNKFYDKNNFKKIGSSGGATYYIGCLERNDF
jgi:hypothetical protein